MQAELQKHSWPSSVWNSEWKYVLGLVDLELKKQPLQERKTENWELKAQLWFYWQLNKYECLSYTGYLILHMETKDTIQKKDTGKVVFCPPDLNHAWVLAGHRDCFWQAEFASHLPTVSSRRQLNKILPLSFFRSLISEVWLGRCK